jgi:VWFA-related protein
MCNVTRARGRPLTTCVQVSCRGRKLRTIGAGLCALILASSAFGRKHSAPAVPGQGILHVTTHLVQVNVIVKDRHGHLVSGLARRDFTIFDNGRRQTISIFKVEETRPVSALTSKFPPDVFSNIPERQLGSSPAVTVILLDGLNTKWSDQAYARQQVIKFLLQLQPGDRVALYTLGLHLRILHDFTTDASSLVRALARYRGHIPMGLAASETSTSSGSVSGGAGAGQSVAATRQQQSLVTLEQWMQRAAAVEANYYMNRRIKLTVNALIAIANHLQGIPGRKNLIWVSGGFPMWRGLDQALQSGSFETGNVRGYGPEISRAAEALNNVNLAIYPVDARGLMAEPGFGAAHSMLNARANRPNFTMPAVSTQNFDTMDDLAELTGGRAFYNTNDIQGAIRRVVDDSRLTYALGYYPENRNWNGQYRKIRVKVDHGGLRLQYRHGYTAVPEAPLSAPEGREALDDAVFSPLDATGVGVAVRILPQKPGASESHAVRVFTWIDPQDVSLTTEGGRSKGSLTVVTAEFSPQGENLKGRFQTITLNLDAAARKKFLAGGMMMGELLPVVPKAERVRVVVRDDPTGQIGSVSVPLDRILPRL